MISFLMLCGAVMFLAVEVALLQIRVKKLEGRPPNNGLDGG